MRLSVLLLSFIMGLFSVTTLAGSGHGHSHAPPITQQAAVVEAKNVVSDLVAKNNLEVSWLAVDALSAEKKSFNGPEEWVVIFKNEAIINIEKRQLYIFLSLSGDFIAGNHSGE